MIENPMHTYGINCDQPEGIVCEECGCEVDEDRRHLGLESWTIPELANLMVCHEIPFLDDGDMDQRDYLDIIRESNTIDVDY